MFQYDGPIYNFLVKISDVTLLHLIWFLCSLPIATIGASTTALYGVVLARKEGNTESVVGLYLKYFFKHWRRGTELMVLLGVAMCFILVNLYYWNYIATGVIATLMGMICTALLVPLGLVMIYGFASLSIHETLSVIQIMKQSLYTAYAHPFSTIKLIFFWLLAIWFNLSTLFANVLFLLVGFGFFVQGFLSHTLYKTLYKS